MREGFPQEVTFKPHLHLRVRKCHDLDGPGIRVSQQRDPRGSEVRTR